MLSEYGHRVRAISREAWIVLAVPAAFGFTWRGVEGAIMNLFLVRMGLGPQFVGTAFAVATFGYALGSLPAAFVIRKLGARRGMVSGLAVWMLGTVALTLADLLPPAWRLAWILALRLVPSFGLALCMVGVLPFLTGVTTSEERPHAFAMYSALLPLGAVLGGLAGGLLPGLFARLAGVSPAHPRPYGYALAAGNLVYLPVIWGLATLRGQGPQPRQQRAGQGGSAAPYALLGAIGLIYLLRSAGEFSVRAFFNVFLDSTWSVPAATIGAVIALANLLTIPAPLLTPPLVQRWGRMRTILVGALGAAASVAALSLGGNWTVAAIAYILMTILSAAAIAVWNLLIQEAVLPEWRPLAAGACGMAAGLGGAAVSAGGGYLAASRGYRSTFMVGAALLVAGSVALWGVFGTRPKRVARSAE